MLGQTGILFSIDVQANLVLLNADLVYYQGDLNLDGTVDGQDLAILAANFGSSLPLAAAPVPEPTSLALLSVAGLALMRRRR